MSSAVCFNLDQSKFLSFGNELTHEKFYILSKLKEFADDCVKFDENVGLFFKRVENPVGKGEIACYKQFLLFTQIFLKTCAADK